MHQRVLAVALLLVALSTAWAATEVVIEDWKAGPLGSKGVPSEWKAQSWGKADYTGFTIADEGSRSLHLFGRSTSSMIVKDVAGKVNLKQTPVLQWSWKVVILPTGGDARQAATDDEAGQIYVVWRRFPEMIRSRIIGYVWDTTAPSGEFIKSQKTGTVTYVVVRSGDTGLGKWLTEQRNVLEDYRRIYGEAPDNPDAVAIGIDSDDTKSSAEAYIGTILFRAH
jgi:Protein of unknown function (DUF3047)